MAIRADLAPSDDSLASLEISISAMGQQTDALATAVYSGTAG